MKKMFVGMMVLVLMAMMIVPAFGTTVEDGGMDALKEEKMEEVMLDEMVMTEKGYNYVIMLGGDHVIQIQTVRTPEFIEKIGDGFSWVGTKCSNGFNRVKGWFVRGEVNE